MSSECEILVYGGINIDLVTRSENFPSPGQTILGEEFITYAGGKGANQAVALSKMGLEVCLLGAVGNDVFGPDLIQGLREKGVMVDEISVLPEHHSGVAVINIDKTAQNQIIQVHGANSYNNQKAIVGSIDSKKHLKFMLLQLETPIEISTALAAKAQEKGITVMLDPGPTRPIPEELLTYVGIITPNETEAEYLTGIAVTDVDSSIAAARILHKRGIPSVVVKMGAKGAVYLDACKEMYVPAIPVDAIDSVAAGDAFNGGLTYALYQNWDIETCMRWAVCSGGLATTKTGAQDSMPTLRDVKKLFESHFKQELF